MQEEATWSQPFGSLAPRRQRRASSVNNDSDWSRVSEPLGPDERCEEVDNDGGGHRNSDVGHGRGLLRFLRRRRRTRSKRPSLRARARTAPAAKRPDSSIAPFSSPSIRPGGDELARMRIGHGSARTGLCAAPEGCALESTRIASVARLLAHSVVSDPYESGPTHIRRA